MRLGRLGRLWPSKRRRAADECLRCETSFLFSKAHATIAESPHLPGVTVVAPLCRPCWRDLAPDERLPYYRRLWIARRGPSPQENALVWAAIEAAVKAGA